MDDARVFPATGMPDPDWWHALWPDPDALVADLGLAPGMVALDLACGDGYFTAAMARRVAPGPLFALDLDPAMLEQARAACANAPNCRWVLGDAMELGRLIPEPLDYVLMANTFHGVPHKAALARAVAAALVPGGCFTLVNWLPIPREQTSVHGKPRGPRTELRLSAEEIRALVAPAGFTVETLLELPPYHYALRCRRDA